MIPIVLTGTIIPNAIKVVHCDWQKRRKEYLDAIKYYKQFSKVYFVENSHYDLLHDSEFSNDENFQCFSFEASKEFEKGKGYQEFQMLDEFVSNKLNEASFIKITGRYIYKNFGDMFRIILAEGQKYDLIIDAFPKGIALTSLFYVKRTTYLQHFKEKYLQMDDSKGTYAEHVIYGVLKNVGVYTFFREVPILNAISGTSDARMITSEHILKIGMKNMQRTLLRTFNIKQLLK